MPAKSFAQIWCDIRTESEVIELVGSAFNEALSLTQPSPSGRGLGEGEGENAQDNDGEHHIGPDLFGGLG